MSQPTVQLSRKGVERWRAGHPWIYQVDVTGGASALHGGDVVRVVDPRGWFLGQAFHSRHSKIALRWLTWDDEVVDGAFFHRRLAAAVEARARLFPGQDAYRVVHGEADLLPGLVVDRFGDALSVQFLVAGTERRKGEVVAALEALLRPRVIVNRSDVGVRKLEGLPLEKGVLVGTLDGPVPYREGEVTLEVDLLHGQKTGAFLDQRDNHLVAGEHATGQALDCFSYVGGFALQLARRAEAVTAVEISAEACERIRANARANRLDNVTAVEANAFDFLRDALDEGRRFDTIVIDPPSFAKNKDAVPAALRGYKELNLRALQLLNPGGVLITASCTHHVDEVRFEEMLDSAAADARRRVQLLEKRGAGQDHPVLLGLRETRYLKCFVLRVA